MTARALPNCWLSVGIDIGETNDVHPKNKREIGRRLALVALAEVYHRKVEDSGPVFDSMSVEGTAIRIKFTHAEGLKSSDGKPLGRFTIAGEDRKFVPAEAKMDGSSVTVSNAQIEHPVAVRYAYVNDPQGANLTNASGLPAAPFRSDTWPGVTDKNP